MPIPRCPPCAWVLLGALLAVPVHAAGESPCTLLDPSGAPVCTDADADGRPGRSAACPTSSDCDDTNPTVHPRAPEIPGDGVDNTCGGGGDGAVDESTGIFVARRGNNGAQAGTRKAPFKKISLGVQAAAATGKVVFVAADTYDTSDVFDLPDTVTVTIIGGFRASDWTRPAGARAVLVLGKPITFAAPAVVGLDLDVGATGAVALSPSFVTTAIDSRISGGGAATVTTHGESRMIEVELAGPTLFVDDGTLVAIDSHFGPIAQATNTALELDRTVVSGPLTTSSTTAINRGFHTAPITVSGGVLRLGSSTLRPATGAAVTATAGVVVGVNTIFEGAPVGLAHTAATIVVLKTNLFDVGCAVARDGACQVGPCGADGNVCISPQFIADGDYHLQAGSAAINAGQRFEGGLTPSMSAVDLDGDCRAGELDIGADEVP